MHALSLMSIQGSAITYVTSVSFLPVIKMSDAGIFAGSCLAVPDPQQLFQGRQLDPRAPVRLAG
jgi:hypothetical protein